MLEYKTINTFFNMKTTLTAALTVWMRVNYFLYYQQQSSQLSVDVRVCVKLKHEHLQTKV